MARKAAAMTPTQIKQAGYVIEQYVPFADDELANAAPWVLRRIGTQEGMIRFATRDEAIADLQAELAAATAEAECLTSAP